jgi:hypothetical protein
VGFATFAGAAFADAAAAFAVAAFAVAAFAGFLSVDCEVQARVSC